MIYETREAGLEAFIEEARPIFESVGFPIPEKVKVSIGYPPNSRARKGSKEIAVCIRNTASGDNHWQIFISPDNHTPVDVFAALTHELAHTMTEFSIGTDNPHGRIFGKCARALGLEGKLTATRPGAAWFNWASPIVESIEMPYAHINLSDGVVNKPTKGTFGLKIECPVCKWHARASSKNSLDLGISLYCPTMCGGELVIHPRKEA